MTVLSGAARVPYDARARRDADLRVLSGTMLWLSLLVVVYWWLTGRGVQSLADPTGALLSTGRLTGLVSAMLLLVQVVLMARVPVLEQAWGQARLARIHRIVGFVGFDLMVAHVVLITWGYGAGRVAAWLPTLWDLTWHYSGILIADAGTLALVMVVATSLRAARKRLRYESWHLLHLYAYLGVGLALPHQLWTGQELTSSTSRTAFWWSVWALAAATVLVFRVGVPVVRTLRHDLRVVTVVSENRDTWSVWMRGHRLERLGVEAGQFLTFRFLGASGWTRGNPYSISAAPDGKHLRITVQGGDPGRIKPGARVLIEGPYGRLSPRARSRTKVALLGAGVGITPLRALAEGLAYEPGEAVLLHRFRERPLFGQELQTLARARGLRVVDLPGRRRAPESWLGEKPVVPTADDASALLALVPDIAERDLYVCGPQPWVDAVRRAARAAGVSSTQIHEESFTW